MYTIMFYISNIFIIFDYIFKYTVTALMCFFREFHKNVYFY